MGKSIIKAKDATPDDILKICRLYTEYTRTTMVDVAEVMDTTSEMVSKLLYRAIKENICSDKTADIIYKKIVNCNIKNRKQRIKKLEMAFIQRDNYKREIVLNSEESKSTLSEEIAYIDEKIKGLQNLIEVYDSYCIFEPDAPTLDELENKRFLLEQKKKQLLQAV